MRCGSPLYVQLALLLIAPVKDLGGLHVAKAPNTDLYSWRYFESITSCESGVIVYKWPYVYKWPWASARNGAGVYFEFF